MLGDLLPKYTEDLTESLLEQANAIIPVSGHTGGITLTGMVCAPTWFIFVCGGYDSPWSYGWQRVG